MEISCWISLTSLLPSGWHFPPSFPFPSPVQKEFIYEGDKGEQILEEPLWPQCHVFDKYPVFKKNEVKSWSISEQIAGQKNPGAGGDAGEVLQLYLNRKKLIYCFFFPMKGVRILHWRKANFTSWWLKSPKYQLVLKIPANVLGGKILWKFGLSWVTFFPYNAFSTIQISRANSIFSPRRFFSVQWQFAMCYFN